MTHDHTCIHEHDWGSMTKSISTIEGKLDKFVDDYNMESRDIAATLASMTRINEQTATLVATIQNTMHGPNRDNGVVQTTNDSKARLDVFEKKLDGMDNEADELDERVTKLEHDYIRITIIASILVGVLVQLGSLLGPLLKKILGL